ncbi:hypothetical protein NQ315_006319 [Exocentrus adspersus]|uniref:Cyclic GMP-AMP synthase n=1 Tax=Exocentrus adspersus TaxID=1586481 RepID=A0AAV8W190_9CUCU|nr:hypothetical protein NQ315_006319 [Exocentrus adspersus]
MYERKFYGGSFYDKIKVGKPEEYDLDLVLNLPVIIDPVVEASDKPGFVNVRIRQLHRLSKGKEARKFEKIATLMDGCRYLSTTKVLQWVERIINLSLNKLGKEGNEKYYVDVHLDHNQNTRIYVNVSKAHPAFTLKLRNSDETINLDIDLVPCFQFTEDKWPQRGYRKNPFPKVRTHFLVVPKNPRRMEHCENIGRYWRLSFQEQERELISGQELKATKPAIKLLKKLRDKQNHIKIASYYIKTIFLWRVEVEDPELWQQSLSCVFMKMLKCYSDVLQSRNIPYYWNRDNNLIGHLKEPTLKDISNTVKNIISDVETHLDDPFVIAKYLINQDQLDSLKCEITLGSRVKRKLKYSQILFGPSGDFGCISEDERIKRLILDKEFLQEVSEHYEKYLQPKYRHIV